MPGSSGRSRARLRSGAGQRQLRIEAFIFGTQARRKVEFAEHERLGEERLGVRGQPESLGGKPFDLPRLLQLDRGTVDVGGKLLPLQISVACASMSSALAAVMRGWLRASVANGSLIATMTEFAYDSPNALRSRRMPTSISGGSCVAVVACPSLARAVPAARPAASSCGCASSSGDGAATDSVTVGRVLSPVSPENVCAPR